MTDAKLAEDAVEVILDGLLTNGELLRDFLVAISVGDKVHNLPLSTS